MYRRQSARLRHHSLPALVIVHDLHIDSISIVPDETDAVLGTISLTDCVEFVTT